jgi:hypothetical protein
MRPCWWLAVADDERGYVLDVYPEEVRGYRRQLGKAAFAVFASSDAAMAAVRARLERSMQALSV